MHTRVRKVVTPVSNVNKSFSILCIAKRWIRCATITRDISQLNYTIL